MAAPEPIVEQWVYKGQRTLASGKVGDFWQDDDGRELIFKAKAGRMRYVIGAAHDVRVVREGDAVTMHGKPAVRMGEPLAEPVRAKAWRLETESDAVERERAAAERKLVGRNRDLEGMTLGQLRDAYRTTRTRRHRDAIVAVVVGVLTGPTGA